MIEGEWTILTVEYAGEALPGRSGRLHIIGPRFSLQIGGAPREVGAVEFDSAPAPARLDLVWRDSSGRESRRLRAIVRARGSLLQFCYFPEEAAAAPADFESRGREGRAHAILVRCKRVD